jgi:cytochrome c peroxidase
MPWGKHKVPTLRNVDLRPSPDAVKAYGYNGSFKSLDEIVFFYHWRGMMDSGTCGGGMGGGMGCEAMATLFPPPEVDANRPALPLFPRPQVDNIVAFLKTLSDGYFERENSRGAGRACPPTCVTVKGIPKWGELPIA